MFGANPIPLAEADNRTSTSLSDSSGTLESVTMPEAKNIATSSFLGLQVSNDLSHLTASKEAPSNFKPFINTSDRIDELNKIDNPSRDFVCGFYNPEFIIYSSLCSFYIPCIFMVSLYSRIFWVRISNN